MHERNFMFCKDLLISRKVQTSHIQRQFIIVNYIDLNNHFCLASHASAEHVDTILMMSLMVYSTRLEE